LLTESTNESIPIIRLKIASRNRRTTTYHRPKPIVKMVVSMIVSAALDAAG
jgi:hypothetical protein